MPPSYKFTKKEITAAALKIARSEGMKGITARAVAAELGASSKVIFGSFENMQALLNEVIQAAQDVHQDAMLAAMSEGKYPAYKASGMAYIQFARDEKELFKILYMRDRQGRTPSAAQDREAVQPMLEVLCRNTGLSEDKAYTLHLELWLFVHGIASMIATSFLDWDEEFISQALTDVYLGLKHRFCEEEEDSGSHQD